MAVVEWQWAAQDEGFGAPIYDVLDEKAWNRVFGGPIPVTVGYVLKETVEKSPDLVQAYVNANYRAQQWIKKASDAEIADYDRYNPLSRLLSVLDRERSIAQAKMAKHGRNNETTMAMRAALQNLFRLPLPWIPDHVRGFAKDVFEAIGADKWMLTGEWISSGEMVMGRPLATGYGEETLQAVWSVHARECGVRNVRYVANSHARADGDNAPRKEDLMMSSLSAFLLALVMNGVPPCDWTLVDIARFNRSVMSQLSTIPVIGQDNRPVHVHEIKPEAIIPSVDMLLQHGFVDLDKVRAVVASAS
jgi:hypothetical protein